MFSLLAFFRVFSSADSPREESMKRLEVEENENLIALKKITKN